MALLILRATLGVTSIIQGGAYLLENNNPAISHLIIGLLFCAGGSFLLIGLMTPVFALLILILSLGISTSIIPAANNYLLVSTVSAIYIIIMAFSLSLLGPGAYSLDARMFGRREIIIPDKPDS